MPPPILFDYTQLDLSRVIISKEEVYRRLPHRYEFMQLDGILYLDLNQGYTVAFRDVRDDEFWVRGHIPARAIMPGVLSVETAAHLASYVAMQIIDFGDRFLGLGGLDNFKFREGAFPGDRIIIIAKMLEAKPRRVICACQGFVKDKMIFEGDITGMPV
ncbi:MAG: 3-hydroxyacyl-[acyl-carrier-protein] dehydratase FabZ [Phycisphaerae bacterium]|nr:3-hydroxyacyl-[acyl-carrier-protein] dehydratase FabZ [Phycisphaerae bacterium]